MRGAALPGSRLVCLMSLLPLLAPPMTVSPEHLTCPLSTTKHLDLPARPTFAQKKGGLEVRSGL